MKVSDVYRHLLMHVGGTHSLSSFRHYIPLLDVLLDRLSPHPRKTRLQLGLGKLLILYFNQGWRTFSA